MASLLEETMIMRHILIIFLFGALIPIGSPTLLYAQETTAMAVRQTVESYAHVEFEGGDPDEREKIIRFSPKRKAQIEDQTGMWAYVDYSSFQRIVARGYLIEEVKLIDKKRAMAMIRYDRLAHSVGKNASDRVFMLDTNANDTVTLNLVFDKNQWWVLDPPPPRVSKEVLIRYYEYQVKEDSAMWEKKLSDPTYDEEQKANVRANRDQAVGALQILKSLP